MKLGLMVLGYELTGHWTFGVRCNEVLCDLIRGCGLLALVHGDKGGRGVWCEDIDDLLCRLAEAAMAAVVAGEFHGIAIVVVAVGPLQGGLPVLAVPGVGGAVGYASLCIVFVAVLQAGLFVSGAGVQARTHHYGGCNHCYQFHSDFFF